MMIFGHTPKTWRNKVIIWWNDKPAKLKIAAFIIYSAILLAI
tara:strand:- start:62 stop:187 length:126 start_codon:yes stop_codon:yes gene_type:complete